MPKNRPNRVGNDVVYVLGMIWII